MVALERTTITKDAPAAAAPSSDAISLRLRRRGGTARQVLLLAVIGTAFLAVFASHDLASWLDRTGDGPLLGSAQRAATSWDHAMAALGLTRPAETLRNLIGALQDWDWR